MAIIIFFDGFPFWQIKNDFIITKRLFRKKKIIQISKITAISEKEISTLFWVDVESIDVYVLSDGNITLEIPKGKASDALIKEIKERNDI